MASTFTMSYFDTIPNELNIIIISMFGKVTSINNFSDSTYQMKLLFQRDKTYQLLFKYKYASSYKFITSVKNIDGNSTWKDLYTFYLNPSSDNSFINKYILDIYYLNLIKLKYRKFYNQIKDIILFYRSDRISSWKIRI